MEIQQYLAALKRRWPYMVASIVIICGIVAYHVKTSPPTPTYRAQSRIFVAAGASSVTADDVAQMAVSNSVAAQTINFVMNPVPGPTDEEEDDIKFRQVWKLQDPISPTVLLQRLRADVGTPSGGKSSVVTISAVATNAGDAVRLANKVADFAKQEALGLTQLGTYKQGTYIKTELDKAKADLDAAQAKASTFKELHRDLIVPLSFDEAKRVIGQLEQEARNAEIEIHESNNRVAALRRTLGTRSNATAAVDVPSSAVVDRLKAELATREVELMNDRLRYTDDHPKVKQSRQAIENITSRLTSELQKSFKLENAPTSLEYQFLTGDVTRYEAQKLASQARLAAVRRALAQARGQLTGVPVLEAEYARLNTDYLASQQNYMELRNKYDQAQLSMLMAKKQLEDRQGIGIIDPALSAHETPGYKFQKPKVKLGIAFLMAVIIGMGIILFLEGLDTSIRDVDQVEDRYQLPVLGVVPELKESALKSGSTLVLRDAPSSAFAEPYRLMRTNYLALAAQAGARSILITSTLPGEGKSTTAANFASSLAEGHKKVILIDGDMRNPSLHRAFGIRKEPGLSDYLAGDADLDDVIFPTNLEGLLLISAGHIPENPSRLLTGERMRELLEDLSRLADFVVVDTPPAVAFSDAMEIASLTDTMILVVGAGSKLESAHFRARSQLANAHAMLVGTVLNRVQPTDVDSYRYSSRYYPRLNGNRLPDQATEPAALPESKS